MVVQRLLVERSARPRLRRAPGHAVVPRPLGLGLGLQIRLVEGHVVVVVVAIVVDLEAVVVVVVGLVGRAALVGRLDGRVLLVGVVVVVVVGVEVVAGRLDGRLAGLVVVVVVVVVLERLGHDALDELLPLLRELEAEAVRDGRVDLLDRVARARHRVGPDPGHDLVARVARVVVVDGRLAVRLERVARVVVVDGRLAVRLERVARVVLGLGGRRQRAAAGFLGRTQLGLEPRDLGGEALRPRRGGRRGRGRERVPELARGVVALEPHVARAGRRRLGRRLARGRGLGVEARGLGVARGGLGRERRDPRHTTALLSAVALSGAVFEYPKPKKSSRLITKPRRSVRRSLNPETQFPALNPEK